jgi:hypothetical protein
MQVSATNILPRLYRVSPRVAAFWIAVIAFCCVVFAQFHHYHHPKVATALIIGSVTLVGVFTDQLRYLGGLAPRTTTPRRSPEVAVSDVASVPVLQLVAPIDTNEIPVLDLRMPMQTRDGRLVRLVSFDAVGPYPIVVLVMVKPGEEQVTQHDRDGRYSPTYGESELDLFNIPA